MAYANANGFLSCWHLLTDESTERAEIPFFMKADLESGFVVSVIADDSYLALILISFLASAGRHINLDGLPKCQA